MNPKGEQIFPSHGLLAGSRVGDAMAKKVQLEVMRRGHCGVESLRASRERPGVALRWLKPSSGKASSGIPGDCQFKFDSPGVQLILWVYTLLQKHFFCV